MIKSPFVTRPVSTAVATELFNKSSVVLRPFLITGYAPQTSANWRAVCALGVTAMISECGRYLEIVTAVEPLSVAATIALTFKLRAVCATETPIALTNDVSTSFVRSDNNFCSLAQLQQIQQYFSLFSLLLLGINQQLFHLITLRHPFHHKWH